MAELSKLMVPLLLMLYFVSWIIAMGGLAAAQDLFSTSSWSLALYWFILFFQLFIIIAIPLVSVMGLIKRLRVSLIGVLAILSSIWLIAANEAYQIVRGTNAKSAPWNTVTAGASMLFITNVFAMFLLDFDGSGDEGTTAAAPANVKGTPPPVTVVQIPETKNTNPAPVAV